MKKKLKILGFLLIALLMRPKTVSAVTDISGHWAEEAINYSITKGCISGYADGTFKPDSPIKRSEFIALANRSMSFTGGGSAPFSDVSEASWYYNDVCIARREGYISGFPDGTFRPEALITRETAAVMAASLLHLDSKLEYASYFSDGERLTWSKGAVGAAVKAGIISGYTNGEFGPERAMTRAEAVSLINGVVAKKFDSSLDITYGYSDYYSNYSNYDTGYINEERRPYQSTNLSSTTEPDSTGYYRMYNGNYGSAGETENFYGNIQYDPTYAGTVQNIFVSGDFALTTNINPYSELTLQNVTIRGKLIVYSVGKVTLRGSDVNVIEFRNGADNARIYVTGGSKVNETYVYRTVSLVNETTTERGFRNVYMDKSCRIGETVSVSGGFNNIYVNGKKAKLVIESGTVETVEIESDGAECDVEVKSGATVNFLDVRSSCHIHGKGKIVSAKISAEKAEFDLKPQNVSGSKDPEYTSTASEGGTGSGESNKYEVEVTVVDSLGAVLPGISVKIDGYETAVTGSDGTARITGVSKGTYQCTVSSVYSQPLTERVTVNNGDVAITIRYDSRAKYNVIITVKKDGKPLKDVPVSFEGQKQVTSSDGTALFSDIYPGSYSYSAEYEGNVESGSVTVVNMTVSREINFK